MALTPDRYTVVKLIATAARLYDARGDRDTAVAELRDIADGRTDLLAQAAGYYQGSAEDWNALACYQLLVDAGADINQIPAAAERVRRNRDGMDHTTAGTREPGK